MRNISTKKKLNKKSGLKNKKSEAKKKPNKSNSFGFYINFLIVFLIIIVSSLKMGPLSNKLVQHRYLWDTKTYIYGIETMQKYINMQKPELILLGNSTLRQGIIGDKFNKKTKIPTLRVFFGGSGAAWFYLTVKNVITKAKHKPKKLAIFFWDNALTDTQWGVKGQYQPVVDMTSLPEEPLLDRLSFLNEMSEEAYFLSSNWTIYQKKNIYRTEFDNYIKRKVASWFGKSEEELNLSIKNTFSDSLFNKKLYNEYFEKDLENKATYQFKEKLSESYLPTIINLIDQAGIELIFVRVKKRLNIKGDSQKLKNYMVELKKYLKEKNIPLLDYSQDERLKYEHFADDHHLNGTGQQIFTDIFAKDIVDYTKDIKRDSVILFRDLGI